MDGMGNGGKVAVAGMGKGQISLLYLFGAVTFAAMAFGIGRALLLTVRTLSAADVSLLGWVAGMVALAVVIGAVFVYANR